MIKKIAIIIIFMSFVLIVVNIFTIEKGDNGFWLRIISSSFVILAMFLTIRQKNEK
jgi:uncharacterized membrane protein YozB (DUF420 family)